MGNPLASIVWARSEGVTYRLGDIGPGGGLVFLIAGGLTYEMAPRAWGDPDLPWCNVGNSDVVGAIGVDVGTGSTNTVAMVAACATGAANSAAEYRGGGLTDWFLPSRAELNAMYSFAIPAEQTSTYGFAPHFYWSSTQDDPNNAWGRHFNLGNQISVFKPNLNRVRPIRAF